MKMVRHSSVMVIAFLLMSSAAFGQILTFEFSALAGNEVSASSNFNDANLTSSTITRGSGVTASANAQRFNSTSWATGALDATDYVEFTITPNSGKKFSITSVVMQHQRSGTGPTGFAIRSSVDSYAADLATATGTDVTSTQTATFTFSQTDILTATTYRIYAYSAEAGSGTWGPGDGTGNDITVNGSTAASSVSEPTTSATSVNFTSVGAAQFTVNWTNGDGTSRLVLMKSGSAVDASPADEASYTANTAFGSGQELGTGNFVVYSSTGNNVTVTGLSASTTYHVSVFEYNGSGSGSNFLLTTPATGSQSTSAAVSSASDIVSANNETNNIDYASKQSADMTGTSDGVRVWSFTLRDGGGSADADAFGTELNSITIGKGGSNTVSSWTNTVRRAALYDGSTEVAEVDVTGETISFTGLSGAGVTAADDGSKTLDLYLTFETAVTDNQQFHFLVTAVTDNPAMSQIAAADAGAASSSVTGDANKIEVTATKLVFTAVPGQAEINSVFSVSIAAQDGNNILDADAATSVTLSRLAGTGALTSVAGLTQSLASGVYTWSDTKLNVAESGVTLQTANTGGLTDATSSSFNIVVGDVLFIENFDYTSGTDVTANGWTGHSGSATPPVVSTAGLTYAGYSGSNTGKAADVFGTDQDVNRSFTTQKLNGASVYLSAMVNVSEASASQAGTYFLHLGARDPNVATTFSSFCTRIFVRVVTDSVNFGLSNGSSTATWASTNYGKNTTYLIVAKYTINTGGSDVAKLWVIPTGVPASETEAGAALLTITDAAQDSVNAIGLRQASGLPDITVDGIRIATSWGTAPLPVELSSFTAVVKGRGVELSWQTATEQNNHGFEVERMMSDRWTRIGFVEGHGTTNAPQSYIFTDASAKGKVAYRLKQIDRDGAFQYSHSVEANVAGIVTAYALGQNYPNPFNPSTTIQYQIPVSGNVSLKIFDMLGKEVAAPVNGFHPAGAHAVSFDASQLSSGIYFYQIRSGSFLQTRRMQLLK